jgi:TonB family protein
MTSATGGSVRQFAGDVGVERALGEGGAAGRRNAVLIARQSEATDLGNVVSFARPRRHGAAAAFPLASISVDERPAPPMAKLGFAQSAALFAGSLALHSALLAMFWHEPKPMASVGIEVMNVEITLGANTAAGLAPTPGEQEAVPAERADDRTDDPTVTERSRAATVMPQEVPVAAQDTAPEVKAQDTRAEVHDRNPQEQQPETTVAEVPAAAQPTERSEHPRPQVQAVQEAPERKRIEAPTDNKAGQKKQVAATSESDGARGIGRGRSDRSANYEGTVFSHLGRHKQATSDGHGTGVAIVHFSIDSRGRVTSVRLATSSGVSVYDQEALAMARRASPFPPPPDGKGRDYSIPVRFTTQ